MKGRDERYPDYPLFKGLQRPLEFMGIQGRYIYWAAGSAGGAIVGFVAGLVVLAVILSVGISLIILKQRKGLHTKKNRKGVYVYARSKKI